MASSSGTISGSSGLQKSGSEEDPRILMDQRKRKRMISNRESARRSRMRKQKHLDELKNLMARLRNENSQIITAINVATRHYLNVEAENSVLRAQVAELSQRFQSLNEIIDFLNVTSGGFCTPEEPSSCCFAEEAFINDLFMNNSRNNLYASQLPLMASADLLHY